jgi:hypothetical protein
MYKTNETRMKKMRSEEKNGWGNNDEDEKDDGRGGQAYFVFAPQGLRQSGCAW